MVGIGRSWVAPIVSEASNPNSELPLTTKQASWIASLSALGQCVAPFVFFSMVDKLGRKMIVIFNASVCVGVWIGVYWSRDVSVHYVLRLFFGVVNGLHYMVTPMYVCENCSPQFRSSFLAIAFLFRHSGQTAVYLFATLCTYSGAAVVYIALSLIALLSTLLLVESPQFLLVKGNVVKAEENFARLRDMIDAGAIQEFEAMKENIEEEKMRPINIALFRSKEVFRSMRIILVAFILYTGSGLASISFFMTKLFSSSNNDGGMSANAMSMLCSLFNLFTVGATSLVVEKFKRRTFLLASSTLTCIMLIGIAILYYIQSVNAISSFRMLLFCMFSIYSCIHMGLVFPLLNILRGELLPHSVKRTGLSLGAFFQAAALFASSRMFLPIAETFGMGTNFAIFALCNFLMIMYIYFDVPETRGKTLVEIQNDLKGIDWLG